MITLKNTAALVKYMQQSKQDKWFVTQQPMMIAEYQTEVNINGKGISFRPLTTADILKHQRFELVITNQYGVDATGDPLPLWGQLIEYGEDQYGSVALFLDALLQAAINHQSFNFEGTGWLAKQGKVDVYMHNHC
ncbi:hypothetical protein Lp19_1212 [Lactiplantibacillus plantarum]|uniref:Uncharacterized protein n=1 Tax=Lactiplantibacillus plantarum TaxID=1590 RepID=A0A165RVV0_LACPN|nr:hypothetical protein [Lactiplantibacillus plantarum]KZU95933.1 hypothetical protein Lp19_1212 [Lactiplantibacillus plantarum]